MSKEVRFPTQHSERAKRPATANGTRNCFAQCPIPHKILRLFY